MKNERQNMILEIISQENIETQEQLLSRLQERGITSTQATISRDIKQMHQMCIRDSLRAHHRRQGTGKDLCHPEEHPGGVSGRTLFAFVPSLRGDRDL